MAKSWNGWAYNGGGRQKLSNDDMAWNVAAWKIMIIAYTKEK